MKLIAQMVARNEEGRYLTEVLRHLSRRVDKIVFTDDASTDGTPDIAKHFGAHVYQMDSPTFVVDESKLRRTAWENLEPHAEEGDWILGIDADEFVHFPDNIDELLNQRKYDVLGVTHYQMWSDTHFRVDGAWKPHVSTRLFRYYEGGTYRDRKLAGGSEPDYVASLLRKRKFLRDSGVKIQHMGYARDEDKQAKYDRYMEIDGGKYHSLRHLKSIVDKDPVLAEWNRYGASQRR